MEGASAMKVQKNQPREVRAPAQPRAQHKVELILEAAMRLLDKGGTAALTTNAVAGTAGVSIGTLYQYFANKEAILDALAEREIAELSRRVLGAFEDPQAGDRVAGIVRSVTSSYGGRRQVHLHMMEYHAKRHGDRGFAPLFAELIARLTTAGAQLADDVIAPMPEADAFVLTYAFVGVLRASILQGTSAPPQPAIEEALGRLESSFNGQPGVAQTPGAPAS
jgi:AcrR family transcriptional regulator